MTLSSSVRSCAWPKGPTTGSVLCFPTLPQPHRWTPASTGAYELDLYGPIPYNVRCVKNSGRKRHHGILLGHAVGCHLSTPQTAMTRTLKHTCSYFEHIERNESLLVP